MYANAIPSLDCFRAPPLWGWPALQAWLVDLIKRAALRQLHATRTGEILLLRTYLIGEEATEQALQRELLSARPDWLARQMDQHLAEEQRHADAFALALAERGVARGTSQADWLSRRKIAQWHRLARRHAPQFSKGVLVPVFAIGLCAEQMAARVLQRNCAVVGADHPLHSLLSKVLADEKRHVRLCGYTLSRLVAPDEYEALVTLLREVRAVERSFGVSVALAMYAAGLALRVSGRGHE